MQIPNHLISSWCLGTAFFRTPRERLFAMAAGIAPDLDGVGIVFDVRLYHRFHHVVGHNIVAALVTGVVLSRVAGGGLRAFAGYVAIFLLHLLLDFLGSGAGWGMRLLWPLSSRNFENPYVWGLDSWPNAVFLGAFIVWMLVLIGKHGETPLAAFAPRLDRRWADAVRRFIDR